MRRKKLVSDDDLYREFDRDWNRTDIGGIEFNGVWIN